jgi:WD40 repeat protein/tRNA A-37 threonylcarbamoyl transferase component Bud32
MKEADLFCRALDRPPAGREEFLRTACEGDEDLRAKIEALLNEHENGLGLLDEPIGSLEDFSGHEPPSAGESLAEDGTRILHFGDYQLKGEIARGAMGVVYRAYQKSLKRKVAVKMIRSAMLANDGDVARFRAEAEAAGSLDHPNIVPIYEVGEFEGQHYFSMKLIEGVTLREHLATLRNNPEATARLISVVAKAIHAAHQRGILHRDLKPGNILIDSNGDPHVTDFGLAKEIESTSSMTLSGQIMGTPSYMAPEQAENGGKDLTTAADVYSLGAVLYELLTGVPPHRGESLMETLKLLGEAEPVLPEKLNSEVDRDLQTIVMTCLAREPSRRFPSAMELSNDLERWLRGEPIESRPVGTLERAVKWMKRKPVHATAAVLGILLLLTLGIGGPLVALRQSRLTDEAVKAREIADKRAESLREQMYSFEMLAGSGEAMKADGIPKISRWNHSGLLNEADLRGWEWFFANSVTKRAVASFSGGNANPRVIWREGSNSLLIFDEQQQLTEWEFETGRIIRRWQLPEGVDSLSGSTVPNRIRLEAGRKVIWKSLSQSEEDLVFEVPDEGVNLTWSKSGKFFAALQPRDPPVKNHSTLRIWPVAGEMVEAPLIEMKGVDNSLQAWSTDGRLAIAREPFGEIITFDRSFPDTPLAEANVMGRIIGSQLLQWSPDDRKIAFVAEDGEIRVVDGETLGAPEGWRKAIHTGTLYAVAWSPNGSRLVTGGDDRIVRIWDTRTGEEVLSIRGSGNSIRALAWSPDGKWIASGELGGMIRIWNAKEDSRPPTIQADPPLSVNTLEWNPKTEQVAISANQSWIYSAHVLDVAERRLINKPEGAAKSVAWHPDGKRIAAAHLDGGEDLLKVSDLESGEDLWGEGPGSWQLAWTPDGRRLAAMHSEGYLNIYRGQDGTLLQKIEAPSGNQRTTRPTHQFRFSPDGGTLAWGQKTGNIALINPETGAAERVLEGHSARVGAVAWSRDGERIASASEDHTIRIWDFSSASVLVELIGHSSAVLDVQWSPDESRLATASRALGTMPFPSAGN